LFDGRVRKLAEDLSAWGTRRRWKRTRHRTLRAAGGNAVVKKILLDCGTNRFQGLEVLITKYHINSDWVIHSFDPNPMIFSDESVRSKFLILRHKYRFFFHNVAVGESDRTVRFESNSSYDETGNTRRWFQHHNKSVEVQQIDFAEFITAHCKLKDFVVCKMDIEGSEFFVLDHLLRTDTLRYITDLYVEWHVDNQWGHTFPGYFTEEQKSYYYAVKRAVEHNSNVNCLSWA